MNPHQTHEHTPPNNARDNAGPGAAGADERDGAHDLAASPPTHLAKLASGMRFVQISLALQIFLPLATIAIVSLLAGLGLSQSHNVLAEAVLLVLSALTAYIGAVGWWRISERDPSLAQHDSRADVRLALRGLMIANGALTVARTILVTAMLTPAPSNAPGNNNANAAVQFNPQGATLSAVESTLLGVVIAQFFVSMIYLRWIATRTDEPELEDAVRVARKNIVLYFTIGWLILVGPLLGILQYYNLLGRFRARVLAERETALALDAHAHQYAG